MEYWLAASRHELERVLLLEGVKKAVQLLGQAPLDGEHPELALGGQTVVGGQVLVAGDLVAEEAERAVERLVVPLTRVDQDAVHVEDDRLDPVVHANTSWALVGWSVHRQTSG